MAGAFEEGLAAYREGDHSRAAKLWQTKQARPRDPRLAFVLGSLYAAGQGVEGNPARAAEFFRQAAEVGLPAAQYNLGLAYLTGGGVERNPREARNWWEKAALQGYLPAQRNLATLLWKGEGLPRDQAEALRWFREAALGGSPEAAAFLDSLLQPMVLAPEPAAGDGAAEVALTPFQRGQAAFARKDYEGAYRIWLPLAEAGDADAQYAIGHLHQLGLGVEPDPSRAIAWYEKAAAQGQVWAQFSLGRFYLEGEGVERNEGLGLYWIQTAADNDLEPARAYMESQR